jgi:hypothetical protein
MIRPSCSRWLRRCWPLLLTAAALSAGCKKEEEGKNSITGHVSTPQGDVGGVIVELYPYPTISSSTSWGAAASHPQVGFPFDLSVGWDYRTQGSRRLDSLLTGADGAFEFRDVADGDYVVSARKDPYGWSLPCAAGISGRSVDVGTLALAPVEMTSAYVTANTSWLSGRHYVVQSTLTVAAGVTLTIQPGTVVRLQTNAKIRVTGTLVAEGEPDRFIIFTSDENPPAAGDWQSITFESTASPPRFRYCVFRFGDDAVSTAVGRSGGQIEYCCFGSLTATGVTLSGGADGIMDSIIFRRNIANDVPVALQIGNVPVERPLLIERNAIAACNGFGMNLQSVHSGAVHCNWFYECGQLDGSSTVPTGALHIFRATDLEVDRNEFRYSYYGVDLGSLVDSSVHIHNNYFYQLYTGLHVGYTPETIGPSFPHFNNNCLQRITRYFVHMDACLINIKPVDATENYWDGLSGTALQNKIYDREDDPHCLYYVNVETILPTCDRTQAGLCP